MPLAKRIIPCLDIDAGRVVKGVKFKNIRDAGAPAETAQRYDEDGADELVFLDITATSDGRDILLSTVREVAENIRIPLTVGGGVRNLDDFESLLRAGADKVSINSAAVAAPSLLGECSRRFGAQCVVLAIDARRKSNGGWEVVTHGGRKNSGKNVVHWASQAEAEGIGEILLTSMDSDGTLDGYDIALNAAVSKKIKTPIIASGGAGAPDHLAEVFLHGGADAALAASIFHDGVFSIAEVKNYLSDCGVEMRREAA